MPTHVHTDTRKHTRTCAHSSILADWQWKQQITAGPKKLAVMMCQEDVGLRFSHGQWLAPPVGWGTVLRKRMDQRHHSGPNAAKETPSCGGLWHCDHYCYHYSTTRQALSQTLHAFIISHLCFRLNLVIQAQTACIITMQPCRVAIKFFFFFSLKRHLKTETKFI